MSYSDLRTVQVVKLPAEIKAALDSIAADESINLASVIDHAILWFLEFRAKPSGYFFYYAPGSNSKEYPVWVQDEVLEKARLLANKDKQSMRAVLYTAIARYLVHQKKI